MLKAFVALLVLGVGLTAAPHARAQFTSTTVSGAEVAASLQTALSGTLVHLHNRGPLTGGSYYLANASSIKVPASVSGIPGQRTRFSLPDESRVILGRRYGYYVDHVRSTGVFVSAGADTFTISISLASMGPALVGTCVRLRAPTMPCATLGETALPAVEWRDARVDIIAKPVVFARSLALEVQSVVIGGDFDVGQACEWPVFGRQLCAAVNRQSQRLRMRVATQAQAALNTDEVKQAMAAGVRGYIDTVLNEALLGVRTVTMREGQLTIGLGFGR